RFGAKEDLAFSSERKWGAIEFPEIGTVYLAAPERLVDDSRLPEAVFTAQENGYRDLMLAIAEQQPLNETKMPYLEALA
ncbi:ATPase, partial [Enterococcus faecalis]